RMRLWMLRAAEPATGLEGNLAYPHETWPPGATLEIVSDAEHWESHSNKYRAQESVSCESSRLRVRSLPRLFRFNSDVHAVVDCSNRSRGACCDRMEVRRIL